MPRKKYSAVDLIVGNSYSVVMSFEDYDKIIHEVGETWVFKRKNFLPYEDGLTLQVEKAGMDTTIRLQWRKETQAHVIEQFSNFVAESSS